MNELKELHDFFIASVGAAAALVGLLFVAVSIAPEKIFGPAAFAARRSDAERALTALTNVFFVSLVALTPHAPAHAIALVAVLGMLSSLRTAVLIRKHYPEQFSWKNLGLLSLLIYAFEFVSAVRIVNGGESADALIYIVLGLYGYALGSSWGLIGGRDDGPHSS